MKCLQRLVCCITCDYYVEFEKERSENGRRAGEVLSFVDDREKYLQVSQNSLFLP